MNTMNSYHQAFELLLKEKILRVESHLKSCVVFFYGPIESGMDRGFREFIERAKVANPDQDSIAIILNTPGGTVETVEKFVEITRHHYKTVNFIVPDMAMSAGTIWCMSGDEIFMDYASSLGPIDPQVFNGKEWVPALGYLDKVEEMVGKAADNKLTQAEFLILQGLDLAMLNKFEQAKNLSITLLKQWLVEYKFKNWSVHQTTESLRGQPVTPEQKMQRAEEIALQLSNNKLWHSHGRYIGISTLQKTLKLRIIDFGGNKDLSDSIRSYNDLVIEFIKQNKFRSFLHHKDFF